MKQPSTWRTISRICKFCSKSYLPTTKWQLNCSHECGYKSQNMTLRRNNINTGKCMRCGKSLIHKRIDALYCSKTCKSIEHNFKARGVKEMRRPTTARRRLIIERDKQICYLCKQFVEYNMIDIDHLVPRTRGGSSAEHNLSVTCRNCNRGRGNRIGIEQLVRLFELRPSE